MLRLAVLLVFLALPARAQFLVCTVVECQKPQLVVKSCASRVLFLTRIDPVCQAQVAALNARAETEYAACLTQQRIDRANCEALNTTRLMEQSTGEVAPGNLFKSDGMVCTSSQECESGFCLPGPGAERIVSSIPDKSSVAWYCANAKANCALPDARGGFYGDVIAFEGQRLQCQNPGRGLWGQFYPPE